MRYLSNYKLFNEANSPEYEEYTKSTEYQNTYFNKYQDYLLTSPSMLKLKKLFPNNKKPFPTAEYGVETKRGDTFYCFDGKGINFGPSLGKPTEIHYNTDGTFTYKIIANKQLISTKTCNTLEECLEQLVLYIKSVKSKPKLGLTKEQVDSIPIMKALNALAIVKGIITVHTNGIKFDKSFGSRTSLEVQIDGSFMYKVYSGGGIIKSETCPTLEECLQCLYIYQLCKINPDIFGVKKAVLSNAFHECIVNKNPKLLNDLILNSSEPFKLITLIKTYMPIPWKLIKSLHQDDENFDIGEEMAGLGF